MRKKEEMESLIQSYKTQMNDLRKNVEKRLISLEDKINRSLRVMEKYHIFFQNVLKKNEGLVKQCKNQMQDFEESLLYIMHNIKKNQFLYSHYPEEWVKSYLDIKKGLQEENKFMDEKEAVNE